MQAAGRPYVMGGVALAGASLVAVTPIAPPSDLPHLSSAVVRLTSGEAADAVSSLTSDLSNLFGLFDSGSPLNIPYDLFINTLNIPYYESLALEEYAYALGPAGSVGGVPGWIPPGATVADGGVDPATDQYALGGTGTWWMESMGNTWGWDNGNYPQLDGLIHFLLPFTFTETLDQQIQSFAQSAFIDGSGVDCEFECANVLGYLGGWSSHGGNLSLPTYPVTQTDTIGSDSSTGVINVGPTGTETTAIWSGQPNELNPLAPLEALWNNITVSPADNPLMLPNLGDVFNSLVALGGNIFNDWFNAFQTGSFIYWGASTDYTIPALIGGLVQEFTGIPNQFANTAIGWTANGAEPLSGYTDGPASLLPNLAEGAQYLANGLLGYLNPDTYLEAIDNDAGALGLSGLLDSAGAGVSADLTTEALSSALPSAATDFSSMLSTDLGANLGSDISQLLTSLF